MTAIAGRYVSGAVPLTQRSCESPVEWFFWRVVCYLSGTVPPGASNAKLAAQSTVSMIIESFASRARGTISPVTHPEFTPGEVCVTFDGEAVTVRTFVSPLFTTVASVFEVLLGWRRGIPEEWAGMIRSRIRGMDLTALRAFDGPERTVPNFLMPLPPSPSPSITDELDALRRTSPDQIQADLATAFEGDVPDAFSGYLTSSEAALDRLCDTMWRYWSAALEPSWPQIKVVLEREVNVTGRELVTKGLATVLRNLPTQISVSGDTLRYPSPQQEQAEIALDSRVLALVPMVCGPRGLLTSEDQPDAVVIAYAARGVSAAWRRAGAGQEAALGSLVGATRARLLQALSEPTTTSALAGHLGITAATTSHHLRTLSEQGLVERERIGAAVYYALSPKGHGLVELFGD